MTLPGFDTLDFLIGDWSIERVISDRRDGQVTSFSGTATVRPAGDGADYLERGQVHQGSHTRPARRTLHFAAHADGSVRVDFQDGRPFLELDLRAGACVATHPCRADTYELAFAVLDGDRIRERWRVTGPAKDYAAETVWRRLRAINA